MSSESIEPMVDGMARTVRIAALVLATIWLTDWLVDEVAQPTANYDDATQHIDQTEGASR